ncbi:HNH endonuclease family protein [Isoptericola sp. b515]|uniref:HNH endonuclease family protein n=1 Tax=Isoptericola sp. b515 TaxID=3064652 RepID=UPI002712E519|nr:HNH endonuclease family protein [Isoptericola sp. b515]MDO8147519.1 HNH endonuclease family protein [Isoptericola sp. b515]
MPRSTVDTRRPAFWVGLGGLGLVALVGLLGGWRIALAFAFLYLAVSAGWAIVTTRVWWGRTARRDATIVGAVAVTALIVVGTASGGTPAPPEAAPVVSETLSPTVAADDVEESADPAPEPADVSEPAAEPSPAPSPEPTTTASADPARGSALAAVATLTVKGRAPMTGYDRDRFGPAWSDVDRNGCDTRNDVLQRDLTDVVVRAGTRGCVVTAGTFHDPYAGETIAFERGWGTSELVQIDHVVALADAWQKGARQWSSGTREIFANDPLNLLASKGEENQRKGAGDTATWLPPNKAFRCEYVARQVAVKQIYELWVTAAEQDAMERVLSTCPDQPLPAGGLVERGSLEPVDGVSAGAPTGDGGFTEGSGPAAPRAVDEDCVVKGNINSEGEHIYHVPGGRFYDVTVPERCFATPAGAEAAGFRASKL